MANFVVQRKSPQELTQEDIDALVKWTTDEGWATYIRPNDISHMYGGPPYSDIKIFLGFLDGKRIGHVALITFEAADNITEYITLYIVEKPLRGKGYGLKIWNAMWECRDATANTCLDSVTSLMPQYESMGLKIIGWDNREYTISLLAITENYKMMESIGNISTKLLNEVEFDKFVEYNAKVYGLSRSLFLKKWTTLPESLTWVAVNENGDFVGCITIRRGVDKQDVIVSPLYSDNLEIAKKLVYTAAQKCIQTSSKNLKMTICVPKDETNAIQMIESDFGVKSDGINYVRMYSKKPKVDISKVIVVCELFF